MATTAAVSTAVAQPAHAAFSAVGTDRCTKVEVSYTHTGPTTRWVYWVQSSNVCAAYPGHFNTVGVDDADRFQIFTHRVTMERAADRGGLYCGYGWRNNGGGSYTNMGAICVQLP